MCICDRFIHMHEKKENDFHIFRRKQAEETIFFFQFLLNNLHSCECILHRYTSSNAQMHNHNSAACNAASRADSIDGRTKQHPTFEQQIW